MSRVPGTAKHERTAVVALCYVALASLELTGALLKVKDLSRGNGLIFTAPGHRGPELRWTTHGRVAGSERASASTHGMPVQRCESPRPLLRKMASEVPNPWTVWAAQGAGPRSVAGPKDVGHL